jgi:cytochrome P450
MPLSEETRRIAPGPKQPLAVGIDPDTLECFSALRQQYGNVVNLTTLNGRRACFINDATDVRKLLVKQHANYKKGPGFERVKMLLGNGLIVSDGVTWRRSRRMIQPAFSRQNLHRLIEIMTSCAEKTSARWEAAAEAGETIDVTQDMSEFSLELILRCIFGVDYERSIVVGDQNPFEFLSKESARDLRVVMQVRDTRQLILRIIRERQERGGGDAFDFLSMYLAARDKDGARFTDNELLDELITLIVAGYETSAGTLNWAWFLLATHPEVEQTLLDEAKSCLGSVSEMDQQSIADMIYAQQVLEETLRLYPPVWLFTRRASVDDSLVNYDMAEGTDIYLSPYILHRSEEYWANPDQFYPERFSPETGTYKKGERPYFPFSLGPRRCLGEYFSFLEMKVHLGLLIQRFHMTLASDAVPALDLGINLRTSESVILRPERRI